MQKRGEWFYPGPAGDKQVAGFVKQFDGIDFVTVKVVD